MVQWFEAGLCAWPHRLGRREEWEKHRDTHRGILGGRKGRRAILIPVSLFRIGSEPPTNKPIHSMSPHHNITQYPFYFFSCSMHVTIAKSPHLLIVLNHIATEAEMQNLHKSLYLIEFFYSSACTFLSANIQCSTILLPGWRCKTPVAKPVQKSVTVIEFFIFCLYFFLL